MFVNRFSRLTLAVGLVITLLTSSCDHRTAPVPSTLPSRTFYALTSSNQLVLMNVQTLSTPGAPVAITGLQANEQILDIDFRPATNALYGVSNTSRIYVINPTTGAATLQGAGAFSPAIAAGASVAIDFNPTVDRLRVISTTGQNLRINVTPDANNAIVVITDGAINGATGASVTDAAYTNNTPTATSTMLYDLDPVTQKLYLQNPPNNGTLSMPSGDGLTFTATNGFDISPAGEALAGLTIGGTVELVSYTLPSGRSQKLGNLPANVIAFAIPTN